MGSMDSKGKNQKKKAGYEYLLAYKISVPVYDYTVVFCKRCQSLNYPNFPQLSSPRTKEETVRKVREVVNLMITLINQAIYLQKKLRASLERKFIQTGGFRENLFRHRLKEKQK